MLVIDGTDAALHVTLLFGAHVRLTLVTVGAAGKACYLQQVCQLMVLPQPGNQMRFVGAADFFARIKACNFFRYAASARSRLFS